MEPESLSSREAIPLKSSWPASRPCCNHSTKSCASVGGKAKFPRTCAIQWYIVTLYENQGNRSDCNNYLGIPLLSIVGKVFTRIVLPRLQIIANRVSVWLQGRTIRSRHDFLCLIAKREMSNKVCASIHFTKAFDLVSRSGMFQLLKKIGCPPKQLIFIVCITIKCMVF